MEIKMTKNIYLSLILMLGLMNLGIAQKNLVPISEVRESVKGKDFYLHTVQKGQTLFSIAAAYNVQTAEIAEFNEDVFDGIIPDQIIKIPAIKGRNNSPEEIKYHSVLTFHYVLKKETLYSIRQRYKVKEEVLLKWNPQLEEGLKDGMVLRIPKEGTDLKEAEADLLQLKKPDAEVSKNPADYIIHTVEPGETLYSISRQYAVPLDVILNVNPDAEDGLSIGENVYIPKNSVNEKETSNEKEKENPRSMVGKVLSAKPCKNDYRFNPKDTFEVALLLPFYLADNTLQINDTTDVNQEEGSAPRPSSQISPKSRIFLEFYEGFLLGMEQMKQRKLPVHLRVFDTYARVDSLLHILKKPGMQKQDLVIGPVYENTIHEFNRFSQEYGIQFVSPLLSVSPEGETKTGNLIQVIPSMESQIKEFCEYLSYFHDKNIVLIHFDTPQEKEVLALYNKYLPQALKVKSKGSTTRFKVDIQNKEKAFEIYKTAESNDNQVVSHPMKRSLRQDMENIVILVSRDQGIVSNSIRELNMIVNEKNSNYSVTLCAFQNTRNYENIDMEAFYNLKFTTFTVNHTDYNRPEVQQFVLRYREIYGDEPGQFAFQGYDLAVYFLSALRDYGKDFQGCLIENVPDFTGLLLQNEFIFQKLAGNNGIENKQITILNYQQDFSILRVDTQYLDRMSQSKK